MSVISPIILINKEGVEKMFSTNVKCLMIAIILLSVNLYSQDDGEKKLGWFFEGKLSRFMGWR